MGIREDWNDKILVFDGGMGSLLQGSGLKPGELPETWNIKHRTGGLRPVRRP